MLIDATIAGREKVEVNPTTNLSRAIAQSYCGDVFLRAMNY